MSSFFRTGSISVVFTDISCRSRDICSFLSEKGKRGVSVSRRMLRHTTGFD